jgi:adenine-specific DNA-methyltransferase
MTTPRKSINPAFLKLKPHREEIDNFKTHLLRLLEGIDPAESEEFHKNLLSDFLKHTYYKQDYFINTKGRKDLVIHTGKSADTPVGVIIETKSPANKYEMCSKENLNTKALQELLLYYLEERVEQKNTDIKHLIVTNVYEWFIFKAPVFEKLFYNNKKLIVKFRDHKIDRLSGTGTDFFYQQIAKPFIEELREELDYAYIDIRDLDKVLRKNDPADDKKLIAPYKLFSPQHLLKLPFANDSNSLDKRFYSELLHLIGLKEIKQGSKKLIRRYPEGERHPGSLLENAIDKLDNRDHLSRVKNAQSYGATREEQLFGVGLELCITWINRILFLKLLEAQLLSYHKGDPDYKFLNIKRIQNYDDLDNLFFSVLAKKHAERSEENRRDFAHIPYLNSSLFEPSQLEYDTLFITDLRDDRHLPLPGSTVLKDERGKKRSGNLNALEYLFRFLDAYDFSSEGKEEIQEEHKTLINASVLGLIFEKINGYKDGSYFTPGFITEYMCRETLRRAVLQKFNEAKGWDCKDLTDLYNKDFDKIEANAIINSLKICDPAVGSGHFLVSALNEILAIKHELRILCDRKGQRLKHYQIEVMNDELIVRDREDGSLFEYHPADDESQRVQETLFHEKQTIIENCLFGVDINPNSVKICRLRLWIELLKNAYYTQDGVLETLPNIDINIKCGNSLISRFDIKADLSAALKKSKYDIDNYRDAVHVYQNAKDKDEKRKMRDLIEEIKGSFRTEIYANDPKIKKLYKLQGDLFTENNQQNLFGMSPKEKAAWEKKIEKLTAEIQKLEAEIEEIKNNKIYENAFEWRFEFPEVLDKNGDFIGFDVVIGNPPYGRYLGFDDKVKKYLKSKNLYGSTGDIAEFFIKLISSGLLKNNFQFSFIVPKGLSYVNSWKNTQKLLLEKLFINQAIDTSRSFSEAAYEMMIFIASNRKTLTIKAGFLNEHGLHKEQIPIEFYKNGVFFFGIPNGSLSIIDKINKNTRNVTEYYSCWYGKGGLTPKINKFQKGIKVLTGKEIQRYYLKDDVAKWYIEKSYLNKTDFERIKVQKVVVQDIVAHILNPTPHIKLTATLDTDNHFCLNTVMCFSSNGKLSNELLIGIINSRFMSFYFYYFIYNQAIRTMHFMPGYADKVPIPINNIYFREIEKLVKKILSLKKKNKDHDSSILESDIDNLIYKAYDLTENEIRVVEGSGNC